VSFGLLAIWTEVSHVSYHSHLTNAMLMVTVHTMV